MAKTAQGSAAMNLIRLARDEAEKTVPMTIPVREIRLNPHNTAAQSDTEASLRELADDIRLNGLIHPLAVNRIGGVYRLISGERRFRAVSDILGWESVPCTVYEGLSPEAEALAVVSANMEAREYSPAARLELYRQARDAMMAMRDSGKIAGGLQKPLAEMFHVSERQIRTYEAALKNEAFADHADGEGAASVTNMEKAAKAATARARGDGDGAGKKKPGAAEKANEIALGVVEDINTVFRQMLRTRLILQRKMPDDEELEGEIGILRQIVRGLCGIMDEEKIPTKFEEWTEKLEGTDEDATSG